MEEANTLERQGDMSSRKVAAPSAMKMGTFMLLVKAEVKVIKKLRALGGILRTKDDEKGHSVTSVPVLRAARRAEPDLGYFAFVAIQTSQTHSSLHSSVSITCSDYS